MDNKRFDSLTKALASGQSRRSVIKGLLGLGGAAAVSTVVTEGTDARRSSLSLTPPPATCPPATPEACPSPDKRCCATGQCNGFQNGCCPAGSTPCTTNVTGCCAVCSGDTPVTCGRECCASDDQCCDGECCGGDQLCVARVLDCSNSRCEEICCDEDQICDGRCCNGTCFQPIDELYGDDDDDDDDGGFDRACCPNRATFCPFMYDNRFGVCCDGETPVCCQDMYGFPICIREDQCCSASDCPALEGQGEEACWTCESNTCVAVERGDQGGCQDCWGCSGIQECVPDPTDNGEPCGQGGFCCDGECKPDTSESFYCEASDTCCDTASEACCDVDGCCGGVCFGGDGGRDTCCPTGEGKLFCSTAQECCEDAATEKCCGAAGCCAGQCFDNDNACCPSDTSFVCSYSGRIGDDDDDDDDDCCLNAQNCCEQDGCCTGSCNDAGRCCAEGQTFACGTDCCDNLTENCCGDYCANLWSDDSENCGACGNVCGECETCSGGTCVPREGSCANGGTCVDGVCTYDLPIFKSDGTTLIDGACFTLYEGPCPAGAQVRAEQCVGPADAQDGSNGRTIFTDLPAGDYCVVETTVPAGFTGGGPVSVNLPANTSGWTVINSCEPLTCSDPSIGGFNEPCGTGLSDGCRGTISEECLCTEKGATCIEGICRGDLLLTSMCTEADGTHKFRVRNPNDFDIDFTYQLYSGPVQGPVTATALTDTFFYVTSGAPGTTKIFYTLGGSQKQQTKAQNTSCCDSGFVRCGDLCFEGSCPTTTTPQPTTTTPEPTTTTPEPNCPGQVQCSGANANCCDTAEQCAPNGDCCATDRIICGNVCCQGPCDTCVDGQCVSNLDDASACFDPGNSYASGICCGGSCDSSGVTTCTPPTTTAPPCIPNCDCSNPANDGLDCNGGLANGGGVCGCGYCVVPLDGCPCGCAGDDECVRCAGNGVCETYNQGGTCNGGAGTCSGEWCV